MEEYSEIIVKTKLPEEMRELFWDVNFDELYFEDYKEFITVRILNFGTTDSLKFLAGNISKEFLLNLLDSSREIDDITCNFWRLMYDKQ